MYQIYDLKKTNHELLNSQVKERLSRIVDERSFIEGQYNQMFETEFAEMQGAQFCRLVANGTDALEISLRAFDIGEGDFVGIPGITFYATAEAVFNIGATPILIDVEKDVPVMCPDSLERMSEKFNLKAVIPVHIYGFPCKMDKINHICRKKNIQIIEDAAQASGTITPLGPAGANPHGLATFSFYPTKNLSAMGDAGAILSFDTEITKRIEQLRNHGRGGHGVVGRNSRCDHFQAAILHLKLSEIEAQNNARKENAKQYYQYINSKYVTLPPQEYIKTSSWHLFPLKVSSSELARELVVYLQQNDIDSSDKYYSKSMGMEPALDGIKGEKEIANSWAGRTVCIPITPFLKSKDIQYIANKINSFKVTKSVTYEDRPLIS